MPEEFKGVTPPQESKEGESKPGTKEQEERAGERYDSKYGGEYHKDWEKVAHPIVEFYEEYEEELEEGEKVLDLGCGQGRNTFYLAEQGLNAYGMDISLEGVKEAKRIAKEKGISANFSKGSFYDLPYKEKTFKAIVSNQSIHDIPMDGVKKVFAEANRVLGDNGLFLLHVKSRLLKKHEGKEDDLLHYYTEDQIKELAEENGFKIESIKEQSEEGDEKYVDGVRGMWVVIFRKKEE